MGRCGREASEKASHDGGLGTGGDRRDGIWVACLATKITSALLDLDSSAVKSQNQPPPQSI